MKTGRNNPCSCGSGKKYKRCCMDSVSKQRAHERNNRPIEDFCGLSPTQMANWIYAPFPELDSVKISTPSDLSKSPVMRYFELMMDAAMRQEGSIKTTSKGNLPAKLVRQASDLLPEFAIARFKTPASISEFTGINEDKFNALHYSRCLAQVADILYLRSGRLHIKKDAQKQYLEHGANSFYLPLLEAAIYKFNWGYFDSWQQSVDLQPYWLFMLWRLQQHACIEQLIEEVIAAFPNLLFLVDPHPHFMPDDLIGFLVESRFLKNLLQFWGFTTIDPRRIVDGKRVPRYATIQPLLKQTFEFSI